MVFAQNGFQGLAVSPTGGVVGSNGTLTVSFSGTVAAVDSSDAVAFVSLMEGSTVLRQTAYNVNYNKLDIPINTRQTIGLSAALAAGNHQLYLSVATVNGGFDSQVFTVAVQAANGTTPAGPSAPGSTTPAVNISAVMAAINMLLEDDTPYVPPVLPSIQLNAPAAGSTIAPGSLAAFSMVTGGPAPVMVQLYANNELIGNGQGSGAAWTFSWIAGVSKTYSVVAKSFDAGGALLAESLPVVVTVTGNSVNTPGLALNYPPIFKSVTREVSYEYFTGSGLLYKKHVEPNNVQNRLDTEYGYDGYGNVSTSTSSPATGTAAIALRAEGPGYDTVGRFPTTYANTLGQTETRVFGAEFGQLSSVIDINQNTASATFDEFGRKTMDVHVDGTQLKTEYFYCSGVNGGTLPCPAYAVYMVQTTPLTVSNIQNGPVTKSYFAAMDQEVKTETIGFDGASVIGFSTEYDTLGRILRKSRPYYASQSLQWLTTYYDSLNRVRQTVQPDGATVTTTYDGLTTTTTNSLNQVRKEIRDELGRVVTIVDNAGKSMTLLYDGFGQLLRTTDTAGNIVQLVYDVRGNKIQMFDPDMGIWNYHYDVIGNLTRRADAKSQITTFTYDLANRLTSRSESDMVAGWTYDACPKGVGRLCNAKSDNGYARQINHDLYGRDSQTLTTIDAAYSASVTYNADTGRVATQSYPNGLSVTYGYTPLGYLSEVRNTTTNALYWKANAMDAENHLTQATYGNNVITQQSYYPATGFVKTILAGVNNTIQNFAFDYDTVGNVRFRSDGNQNLSESFYYEDGVNRLTTSALTSSTAGTLQQSYSYYDNGNIKTRSTLGTYNYGAVNTQPHALKNVALATGGSINYQYDANGNLSLEVYKDAGGTVVAGKGRTETYTSFNMPLKLSAPGGVFLDYLYGPEHQRSKVTSNTGTIIYLNPNEEGGLLYEKETRGSTVSTIEHRNFITAMGQVIAIVKQIGNTTSTSYMHRDNLGSTTAITNESGQSIERLAYEPFGKRRVPNGSSDNDNKIVSAVTARGFTNHEHLESLGLIHMNGRVFDPMLGRFMSADPNIPEPMDMQSYNRYSYVRNNPLTYMDMTGFFDGAQAAMEGQTVQSPRDSMSMGTYDGTSRLHVIANFFKSIPGGDGKLLKQTNALTREPTYRLVNFVSSIEYSNTGEPYNRNVATWERVPVDYGNRDDVFFQMVGFDLVSQIGKSAGASERQMYWLGIAGMVGDPKKIISKGVGRITQKLLRRKSLGRDGAESLQIIEKLDEEMISRTHKVTKDGKVLHEHQNHTGKSGGERQFPDEWTGTTTTNAPYENIPPSFPPDPVVPPGSTRY